MSLEAHDPPGLAVRDLRAECRSLHIEYSISETAKELETRLQAALRAECRSLRIEYSISDTAGELKAKLHAAREIESV